MENTEDKLNHVWNKQDPWFCEPLIFPSDGASTLKVNRLPQLLAITRAVIAVRIHGAIIGGWWKAPPVTKSEWNRQFHWTYTLPETNIVPVNRPLEKEIPIGNQNFQGLC